jgi:hypothetical protein
MFSIDSPQCSCSSESTNTLQFMQCLRSFLRDHCITSIGPVHFDAHYDTDSGGFLVIQGNFQRDNFLWQKIDLPELLGDPHYAYGSWPSNDGPLSQGTELENLLDTSRDKFEHLGPDSFMMTASLLPFESSASLDRMRALPSALLRN